MPEVNPDPGLDRQPAVTLQGLRSSDTLNATVDHLMTQQEAAASLSTDVVSLSLEGSLD